MAEPIQKSAAGLAYRSVARAFVLRPTVFLLAVLLLVVLDIAVGGSAKPTAPLTSGSGGELALSFAIRALRLIAESLALAIAAVSIHRFILLDEAPLIGALKPRRLVLFGLAFAFFQIVSLMLSLLRPLQPLVVLAIDLALILVSIRCALMFPSIALDDPAPISGGWRRSRGQMGEIVAAFVLAMLPFAVIGFGLVWVSGPFWTHPGRSVIAIGYDALWDVLKVASTAVGAGVASWIFRGAPAVTQPKPET